MKNHFNNSRAIPVAVKPLLNAARIEPCVRRRQAIPTRTPPPGWTRSFPHRHLGHQFRGLRIVVDDPGVHIGVPKTGLPDFGHLTIPLHAAQAVPGVEIAQEYLFTYRNLASSGEHRQPGAADDVVKACHPVWPGSPATSAHVGASRRCGSELPEAEGEVGAAS